MMCVYAQVIEVVRVRRVVLCGPLLRRRVTGQALLWLAFVIDTIEANDLLQEVV